MTPIIVTIFGDGPILGYRALPFFCLMVSLDLGNVSDTKSLKLFGRGMSGSRWRFRGRIRDEDRFEA